MEVYSSRLALLLQFKTCLISIENPVEAALNCLSTLRKPGDTWSFTVLGLKASALLQEDARLARSHPSI